MDEPLEVVRKFLESEEHFDLVINGPAGTGKTTLMKQLIEHNMLPRGTLFSATTNKAAEVLSKTLERPVTTIFSALHLVPFDNWKTGKTELKQTSKGELHQPLVVIDEAFMLTDDVLDYIEKARFSKTKIIYVGDSYQLPPVFYEISPLAHRNIPTLTLTKIWRTDSLAIQDISNRFREAVDTGKFGKLEGLPPSVEVLDAPLFVQKIVETFKDEPYDTKIVGWTNNRVIAYNNFVNTLLNQQNQFEVKDVIVVNTPVLDNSGMVFAVDAEATITDIDRTHRDFMGVEYFTVDLNNIIRVRVAKDIEQMQKVMMKYKRVKDWKNFFEVKNFFTDIRHTYACTVHKSQGSSYNNVFVDVFDITKNRNIKEVAKLLYVAASRARNKLIFCMNTKDIEQEAAMLNLLKIYS